MDVIRFIRGKDKNLPCSRSVSLKYAYSTRTVPPRSAPSLAMMEDRSGWPVSSALPVTLHQPFPRTPQKPLFGRIGPQQSLGRSRPHSTGRTACSPSFANAGRLLRASTRSPTPGRALQRSQHWDWSAIAALYHRQSGKIAGVDASRYRNPTKYHRDRGGRWGSGHGNDVTS